MASDQLHTPDTIYHGKVTVTQWIQKWLRPSDVNECSGLEKNPVHTGNMIPVIHHADSHFTE
jgi:hypothetical protein